MADQFDKVLPYGAGVAAVVFAAIFLLAAYFSELMKGFASRTVDSVFRQRGSIRRVGGRQLRRYRQRVEAWHGRHPLGFDTVNIDIRRIYVPLQSTVGTERTDMSETLNSTSRIVVLGEPGAGKSLLLKSEILRWAEKGDDNQVPVIINLHNCNASRRSLRDSIIAEFSQAKILGASSLVERMLDSGRLRVFFDGLDEVGREDRERVEGELREFARTHVGCPMIVTCRTAVYDGQLSPEFSCVARIAEFDDASMRRFLNNWNKAEATLNVNGVIASLRSNRELMRIARRPLLLTIIAYLQSGDRAEEFGPLPKSRAGFYKAAISHLLDRDRQLGRTRAIAQYHANRKALVLQHIALTMHEASAERDDRLAISGTNLESVVRDLLPDFDLDTDHVLPLRDEIVERSQLLRPLDALKSQYGFAHLTLQEFLTAQALHDAPGRLIRNYRNDPGAWREVVKLWCAVASVDCTPVISQLFADTRSDSKILALESLADATSVSAGLAEEIITYFLGRLDTTGNEGTVVVNSLGALASNNTPRGNDTFGLLRRIAWEPLSEPQAAALRALAASDRQEAALCLGELETDDERRAGARAALRSMGEIAIPQLALAAAVRQDIWAVDALGTIGTPAAATELAALLWNHTTTARRAAWLLASLIRVPDVEEALRECETPQTDAVYHWLWNAQESSPSLRRIAGRIGFLLDNGHLDERAPEPPMPDEPIEVREIDRRIGTPIAALGIERYRYNQGTTPSHLRQGRTGSDSQQIYNWVHSLIGRQRRDEFAEIFRRHRLLPSLYCHLCGLLPREVETILLARLVEQKKGPELTKSTWQAACVAPPRSPVLLKPLMHWIAGSVVGVLLTAALARALTTVIKSHPSWIPPTQRPWSSLSAPASWTFLALSVAVISFFFLSRELHQSETGEVLFAMSMLFWAPCFLFLSLELLIISMGVWSTGIGALAVSGIIILGYRDIGRREKNLANPFRRMLTVDLSLDGPTYRGSFLE
ncbi:NACHT domain-containing protein [Streptomyces sp. NPDC088747]|uniref:NACHT domain-containing protein n=1 Tax=Streptomyces sp. NPDC088747 TaxID=3365886 RepID=UPI0037F95881